MESGHEGIPVSAVNIKLVECLQTLGQQARPGRQDSRRGVVQAVVGSPRKAKEQKR